MNSFLTWIAIIGLACLSIWNAAPKEKAKRNILMNAVLGKSPDGKGAAVMLLHDNGEISWVLQPIQEKPVLELAK